MISHTLVFSLALFLTDLYLYDKRSDSIAIILALGFFHLIEDLMWETPLTLFWPLFGWYFPKDQIADGPKFLFMLFKKSFTSEFFHVFIPGL